MTRKIAVAIAATALAAGASTLMGGTAFANGHGDNNTGGAGGAGGKSEINCWLPIAVGGVATAKGGDAAQCNNFGANGGDGGAGQAKY